MFTYTTRKDGRLMKRVSVNGKLKTIYSNNPKDLEKQYIELKHLGNKGIRLEDETITVETWSKKWLELYKMDKEFATINMYKNAINLHIIPFIGKIRLKSLRESHIVQMLNALNNKSRQRDIVLETIKQILDKAIDNNYIYINVASKIKIKRHRSIEKQPLTDLEIGYINQVVDLDHRCFILLFMLYTGLRREEVAALLYKDIDLDNKYIDVNKAIHWENNIPIVKLTKNGEKRKVPILDIIYDTLVEMKLNHKNTDVVFAKYSSNELMTESSMRALIRHSLHQINKLYKRDQVKNNIEDIKTIKFTYHQLRHTYACILHKADVPIKEAQYLLGHKSINILLNIYTHLDENDKEEATRKINNLLKV